MARGWLYSYYTVLTAKICIHVYEYGSERQEVTVYNEMEVSVRDQEGASGLTF